MSWKVIYTAAAEQDLRDILEYIAFGLSEPDTAKKYVTRIMNEIKTLDNMPLRFKLYDEEPWKNMGLRYFSVNNYLVFYLSDEESKIVSIVRIFYGGRDIQNQLKK